MAHVVVGIDGSPASRAALRFAAEEAKLRAAELRIVSAWEVPLTVYPAVAYLPTLNPETVEQHAREGVKQEIVEVLGPEVLVSANVLVRGGPPPDVLLSESENAVMLVLGSRGYGGFRGLLLGSVSQHCASNARCPVVIVRDQDAVTE
jgi:nucleotide-binding universal stress UspA family protein